MDTTVFAVVEITTSSNCLPHYAAAKADVNSITPTTPLVGVCCTRAYEHRTKMPQGKQRGACTDIVERDTGTGRFNA